jgi:hypothetical protein
MQCNNAKQHVTMCNMQKTYIARHKHLQRSDLCHDSILIIDRCNTEANVLLVALVVILMLVLVFDTIASYPDDLGDGGIKHLANERSEHHCLVCNRVQHHSCCLLDLNRPTHQHHCMVWYGMVWYGMVWYGMVWYGMVWYGMVWYGREWSCVPFQDSLTRSL